MFSPMVAMASAMAVSTVTLPTLAALIFSTSAPTSSATWAIIFTSPWKCSLRATKSVSELTSTTTPLVSLVSAAIRPSAATRPAFLAAFDRPFLRSQSCAACMSPSLSVSAALQSIMPAPVDSRRSLTIAAVIVAMSLSSFACDGGGRAVQRPPRSTVTDAVTGMCCDAGRDFRPAYLLFRFSGKRLGLGHPGVGAGRKTNLFANLVRRIVIQFGQLPVVEDAEIVELLLDRAGHAGELLEIVRRTARARQALEAGSLRRGGGSLLDDRTGRSADVDAGIALRPRNAVDRSARHQIAIQRDRTAGVVVAGHDVGDALRIGVGGEDRSHRDVQPLGFLDRDVFLVGVDHEDHVRQAAHVLDAAKRAVELVALALQRQPLFLGVGVGIAGIEHLIEVPQPLDRTGNRLPVGQRTAEPARIDEVLRRALGSLSNAVLGLPLGADKQDTAALGHRIADRLKRAMHQRHGLRQIDDVDVVARTENIVGHFRIPAVRLVAKVHASLKQLTHRKIGYCHGSSSPVGSSGNV